MIRMRVRPYPLKTEYCASIASLSRTRNLTQLTHLQQFLIKATSWTQLGTLSIEFISKNCSTFFQGLVFLGSPVKFDLHPNVKPIHAPVHPQPDSKLKSIKTALDTDEAMGQLIQVPQPTDWISNMVDREKEPTPTKPGKSLICLDPSQTLNKAIRRQK